MTDKGKLLSQCHLLRDCFPGTYFTVEELEQVILNPENRILTREWDAKTASLLIYNKNVILLLVTLPKYRGNGFASALLKEAEKRIKAEGYSDVRFCDGSSYLVPGIPLDDELYPQNSIFFGKRGYSHYWGEEECVDMKLAEDEMPDIYEKIGDEISGLKYRYAENEDRQRVVECVKDAEDKFAGYYDDETLYAENADKRVLIAEKGNEVCGALLVEKDNKRRLGSVGCTSTRQACRGRGIATHLVRLGTKDLLANGMESCWLGYTYTAIVPMYGRAGYKVSMKYMMGVKDL